MMRLVRFARGDRVGLGTWSDGGIADATQLLGSDPVAAIADGRLCSLLRDQPNDTVGTLLSTDDVRILTPIPRPSRILGVGRNYPAHASEAGGPVQERPRIFVKLSPSVIGPNEPILPLPGVRKLDYEAELAIVIGRTVRAMTAEKAMEAHGVTLDNVEAFAAEMMTRFI